MFRRARALGQAFFVDPARDSLPKFVNLLTVNRCPLFDLAHRLASTNRYYDNHDKQHPQPKPFHPIAVRLHGDSAEPDLRSVFDDGEFEELLAVDVKRKAINPKTYQDKRVHSINVKREGKKAKAMLRRQDNDLD